MLSIDYCSMEKRQKKIINCLYKSYISRHGRSISKLQQHSLFILDKKLECAVPEMFSEGDTELKSVKDAFQELQHKGYVQVLGNNRQIRLTEKGYLFASENWFQKALIFLNKNPGVAILISAISLILSIIALLKRGS